MNWYALIKKTKYLIQSVIIALLLLYSSLYSEFSSPYIAFTFAVVLITTYMVHKPNVSASKFFYVVLVPMLVVLGSFLTFFYFPNFGVLIKVVSVLGIISIIYAVSLVNNIFLVVQDRDKVFPLYRAAVTWSQVILIVVSIPLFSGIYKTAWNPILQSLFIGVITFLFCAYTFWVLSFDKNYPTKGIGERIVLSLFSFFCIALLGLSLSFFPTEPFIRSLFISSILMFLLGYIQGHVKNQLDTRMLFEYFVICVIFLALTLLFRP